MILRGVVGETDNVTVHTQIKIKRKRVNGGRVQIVTEPEDKKYSVSFLRGDDYVRPLRVYKGSVSRCGYQSSMCDLLKFNHPFTCIVAGLTGSGKTSFCIKLLKNLDTMCTESRFGRVLYGATLRRLRCPDSSWTI